MRDVTIRDYIRNAKELTAEEVRTAGNEADREGNGQDVLYIGRCEMRESTFTNAICKAESKQISKDFAYCEDTLGRAENAIGNLPSAQPDLQPTCNQLATDAISRQDAIDGGSVT